MEKSDRSTSVRGKTPGSICWVEFPSGTGKAVGIGPSDGNALVLVVHLDKETFPARFHSAYRIMAIDRQGISDGRYK